MENLSNCQNLQIIRRPLLHLPRHQRTQSKPKCGFWIRGV